MQWLLCYWVPHPTFPKEGDTRLRGNGRVNVERCERLMGHDSQSAKAMEYLDLAPVKAARGTVTLPGSKSISNRTLLLAGLADGETVIRDVLESDDTQRMCEALSALGVTVDRIAPRTLKVRGAGGVSALITKDKP